MIGQTFGRWTVIEESAIRANHKRHWVCRCQCGTIKTIPAGNLRGGQSQSCGCLKMQRITETARWKGGTQLPEFHTWRDMLRRCHEPAWPNYGLYGGRGITVCARWRDETEGFFNFLADMGRRPAAAFTLNRRNNDSHYDKDNCEWTTCKEQSRNMRNNRIVTYEGRAQCLAAWAEETGIEYNTLKGRLDAGWSVHDALTKPVIPSRWRGKRRGL